MPALLRTSPAQLEAPPVLVEGEFGHRRRLRVSGGSRPARVALSFVRLRQGALPGVGNRTIELSIAEAVALPAVLDEATRLYFGDLLDAITAVAHGGVAARIVYDGPVTRLIITSDAGIFVEGEEEPLFQLCFLLRDRWELAGVRDLLKLASARATTH